MACGCIEHSNSAAEYLAGLRRALEIVQTAPLAGGVEGVMWSEHVRELLVEWIEKEILDMTPDSTYAIGPTTGPHGGAGGMGTGGVP